MTSDSVLDAIENKIVRPGIHDHRTMQEVWVANKGDDKHDGRTKETAIYSLSKLRELWRNNTELHFADKPTEARILAELDDERARKNVAVRGR